MKLLTKELRERLLANGRDRDTDHLPVVKFFHPSGSATWLITDMDHRDNDSLFGLCDLGRASPELGYVSLRELASICNRYGVGIERDIHFAPKHPLSVYTKAAQDHGEIVESKELLQQAAEDTAP